MTIWASLSLEEEKQQLEKFSKYLTKNSELKHHPKRKVSEFYSGKTLSAIPAFFIESNPKPNWNHLTLLNQHFLKHWISSTSSHCSQPPSLPPPPAASSFRTLMCNALNGGAAAGMLGPLRKRSAWRTNHEETASETTRNHKTAGCNEVKGTPQIARKWFGGGGGELFGLCVAEALFTIKHI